MKHRLHLSLAAAMLTGAVACTDSPLSPRTATPRAPALAIRAAASCGTTTTVNLVLQGSPVGTVDAWNDATDLHVVFNTPAGAAPRLRETWAHAALTVGGIPLRANGNPNLAAFTGAAAHAPLVATYDYAIPLGTLGANPGDVVDIAALASLAGTSTLAWGAGQPIHAPQLPEYFAHTIQRCGTPPPPPPGADIVVFNDINVLDNASMADPNNVLLAQNLVGYTTGGPRNAAKDVWFDCGHGSVATQACNGVWSTLQQLVQNAGYTPLNVATPQGGLVNIPASVKVIFLIDPCQTYDVAEVNALKTFAGEGGRVIFVGEHAQYYGACIPIENQLLLDLGAVMSNSGGLYDCGYNVLPAASLRPHQITTGMTGITMACSSEIILGPNDYPLYYDSSNQHVLSGVAAINLQTTSTHVAGVRSPKLGPFPAGFIPGSPTGR